MECYSKCMQFGSVSPDDAAAAPSRISARSLRKAFRGYRLTDGPGSLLPLIKASFSDATRSLWKIRQHQAVTRLVLSQNY